MVYDTDERKKERKKEPEDSRRLRRGEKPKLHSTVTKTSWGSKVDWFPNLPSH